MDYLFHRNQRLVEITENKLKNELIRVIKVDLVCLNELGNSNWCLFQINFYLRVENVADILFDIVVQISFITLWSKGIGMLNKVWIVKTDKIYPRVVLQYIRKNLPLWVVCVKDIIPISWFFLVVSKHSMFDIIKCKVLATEIIEKWFYFTSDDILCDSW